MATTVIDIATPSGLKKFRETDLAETKVAIDATSGTLHTIVVDNTANAAVTYLKLWNAASGDVTVGTTAPDWVFQISASVKKTIVFHDGEAYATALTAACVTTAGTAGTTGPTSNVIVEIIYET
jgi:hypothetical protein